MCMRMACHRHRLICIDDFETQCKWIPSQFTMRCMYSFWWNRHIPRYTIHIYLVRVVFLVAFFEIFKTFSHRMFFWLFIYFQILFFFLHIFFLYWRQQRAVSTTPIYSYSRFGHMTHDSVTVNVLRRVSVCCTIESINFWIDSTSH